MRQWLAAAVVVAAALSISAASSNGTTIGFRPIQISISQIPVFKPGSSETQFGALTFVGGFVMHTLDSEFGSWSGLDFTPDGTLVAVADTGSWLTAKLVEDGEKPVALEDANIGTMRMDDGKPPPKKSAADAEGLRITTVNGNTVARVSFEQTTTVRDFAGPDFAGAIPKRLPLPKFVSNIRRNQGLEAIALPPPSSPLEGSTVLIAERSLDKAGNHRAFIVGGPLAGAFSIKRSDDFDVSDAAFLPGGDLLILERSFSYAEGFAMRIRRIAGARIKPGAVLDGPVLIKADNSYQIDNMEGLAVRTNAAGDTLLNLVSDDNHGFLQRSVLLQFRMTKPPAQATKP